MGKDVDIMLRLSVGDVHLSANLDVRLSILLAAVIASFKLSPHWFGRPLGAFLLLRVVLRNGTNSTLPLISESETPCSRMRNNETYSNYALIIES